MREFFRGWRRKVGCVTLLMACVFAMSWVRSLGRYEQAGFAGFGTSLWLSHFNGHLKTGHSEKMGAHASPYWLSMNVTPENLPDSNPGFYLSTSELIVPHRSLVLPLTLLAAWLILWKPRMRVKHDA